MNVNYIIDYIVQKIIIFLSFYTSDC